MEACAQLGRRCSAAPGLKAVLLRAEGAASLLEVLEERSPKVLPRSHPAPKPLDITLCSWAVQPSGPAMSGHTCTE